MKISHTLKAEKVTGRNILVLIAMCTFIGCFPPSDALQKEMGPQDANPPSVAKTKDHPEEYVDLLMDGAIQAATRLGFSYDASKFDKGWLRIIARWKNSPVEISFKFYQDSAGMVNYTYMRECNGAVLAEQGDAKILELFLSTLDQVMNDGRADPAVTRP